MEQQATPAPIRIVIGQRGWVWIGRVTKDADGQLVISNAQNIRRWGTTGGLGELAADGPQDATRLDPAGTVRIHELAVVAQLDANEATWAPVLA